MKTSTDIWFCSFLMLKGYKISSYKVITRGKVSCDFEISEEKWQVYKLEFNNSEFIKFKSLTESIKDLSY